MIHEAVRTAHLDRLAALSARVRTLATDHRIATAAGLAREADCIAAEAQEAARLWDEARAVLHRHGITESERESK